MTIIKWQLAGLFLLFTGQAMANDSVQVDYIHIPPGFDDNDTIELTIDGYLRDCQKVAGSTTEVVGDTINVIQTTETSDPCLFPVVPFSSTIRLEEPLSAGTYSVVAESKEAKLTVKEATVGAVDEANYVPIDTVNIEQDPVNKKHYVVLRGRWQVACMKFKGQTLPTKTGSVIEILPEVFLDEDVPCDPIERSFERRIELPGLVPGHYLVHIRSASGASFNLLHMIYRMN